MEILAKCKHYTTFIHSNSIYFVTLGCIKLVCTCDATIPTNTNDFYCAIHNNSTAFQTRSVNEVDLVFLPVERYCS